MAPPNEGAAEVPAALDSQKQGQVEQARAIFIQLVKGFKNIALHRHNPARFPEHLDRAFQLLIAYLELYPMLAVKVEATSFSLYGQPLLPSGTDESLAYRFHRDGIRHLIFRQGIDSSELVRFALIATTNFEDPAHRGEDILGALWNAELEHVEHLVVEGFSFGELSEEDVNVEVDKIVGYLYQRLRSKSDDFLRFARLSTDDLNLKMEAIDQLRGAVIQGEPVTEKQVQAIQAELADDEGPRLLPKLVAVIFTTLEDEIEADVSSFQQVLSQLIDAMLIREDFSSINQVLVKLRTRERVEAKAATSRELRSFVVGKMAEPERLRRLIDVLRAGPPKQPQEIQRYLLALDNRALIPLLEGLESLEVTESRQLVCDALIVLGAETPEPFVARLGNGRSSLVRDMLYILERIEVPDRVKLFEGALRNPNIAVRLEALAVIALGKTEGNRALILQALKDAHPEVRVHAARALVKFNPERGFADLEKLVLDREFRKRPLDEREALFAALGGSQQPGVLTLCAQFLQRKGRLFKRRRATEDKLVAIAALSECPSIATYKLLQAESAYPSNAPEVATAARRAMGRVRKELFGDAPQAPEQAAASEAPPKE